MGDVRRGTWFAIAWAVGTGVLGMALSALGGVDLIVEWYLALRKPWWQPPAWVFGPAWSIIFALSAWAFVRAWRAAPMGGRTSLVWAYVINGILNVGWSVLFFGMRSIELALLEVGPLWLSVLVMLLIAGRHDRVAGWLLLPYLLWVGFAGVLNFALWRLNG
jgi:tryptophan-rich sensory protein